MAGPPAYALRNVRFRPVGRGLKETGEVIGQCGLTMQEVGDSEVLEVGYLFRMEFWHHGYALEAAAACRDYAFEKLGAEAVYSIIRENNGPSRAVAERNGMTVCGSIVKHYYGLDMAPPPVSNQPRGIGDGFGTEGGAAPGRAVIVYFSSHTWKMKNFK